MLFSKKYFIICLFILFSVKSNAQISDNDIVTNHSYIFKGGLSSEKLLIIEQQMLRIEFVSEAKIKYKPEKGMGQILFVTREKPITKEGQKTFSPTSVKQLLMQNNLTPAEYSQLKP